MENAPFLTISIPTWHRAEYLRQNLDNLTRQIARIHSHPVEIFISDNASEDNTGEVCRQFTSAFPFVRYHRNTSNIGANANFEQAIAMAKGQYIWLLGDDDLIVEGSIEKVLRDIEKWQPDILTGPAIYSDTQQKATHQHIKDTTLGDRRIFASEEMIALVGKISGLIFKKSAVDPILPLAREKIQATRTPWPHIVWVILILNEENTSLLMLSYGINVLVHENWHNLTFTGSDLLQIHFTDYLRTLKALRHTIQPECYEALMARSVATRQNSLLKCVFYATWLDGYTPMLKKAFGLYRESQGARNRLTCFLFLILPLLCPPSLRRGMFACLSPILYRLSPKFKVTVSRIQDSGKTIRESDNGKRGFDSGGL